MSRAIGKTTCPRCRERGADSRGDNLVLYDDGGAHCFACGHHVHAKGFSPKVERTTEHGSSLLPPDFSREVPADAWKWLLQYGLPLSYWRPFVGWSEKSSRLVFTVGDPAVFSIGRLIKRESTRDDRKWYVWGDSHKTGVAIGEQGPATVFVEDIVSAHKVGRVTQAVALFGTTPYPAHLRLAKCLGNPIVLWLDKDQQGSTLKKANQISMLTGLSCRVVHTDKDPKELDLQTVKEILNR
ncbi:MAG TPA: toprim domain-containing protein [Methanosarcina sp.]|nr:toprim domain-containing protein [Methanosarcina sp.]